MLVAQDTIPEVFCDQTLDAALADPERRALAAGLVAMPVRAYYQTMRGDWPASAYELSPTAEHDPVHCSAVSDAETARVALRHVSSSLRSGQMVALVYRRDWLHKSGERAAEQRFRDTQELLRVMCDARFNGSAFATDRFELLPDITQALLARGRQSPYDGQLLESSRALRVLSGYINHRVAG